MNIRFSLLALNHMHLFHFFNSLNNLNSSGFFFPPKAKLAPHKLTIAIPMEK